MTHQSRARAFSSNAVGVAAATAFARGLSRERAILVLCWRAIRAADNACELLSGGGTATAATVVGMTTMAAEAIRLRNKRKRPGGSPNEKKV